MSHQSRLKALREYRVWTNMKTRCYNPKCRYYARYGGREITVCDRWKRSFSLFLQDMGPCPDGFTIERKDNDLGYQPGNCIWASRVEQGNNRTTVRKFKHLGQNLSIAQWGLRVGIPEGTIRSRINRGEPIERAIDTTLWHCKLSLEQVREVRKRLRAGEAHEKIASSLGVDRSTITAISCGKNWKEEDAACPRVEVQIEVVQEGAGMLEFEREEEF